MKDTISKNLFLNAVVCPTLGWRLRADEWPDEGTSPAPTLAQQFRMEEGADIGRRARNLFPGGVMVSEGSLAADAIKTAELVRSSGPSVLFEATFLVDDYAARADVLTRDGDGWHLIEVKSNVNLHSKLIDDLGYTLMVISRAGLRVTKASLLLISKEFRLGMDDSDLFIQYDRTEDALTRATQFQLKWDVIRDRTSATSMPAPTLIPACKTCTIFSDCLGKGIENHIFNIPRLSQKKIDELKGIGVFQIEDLPESFPLTTIQSRTREAVVTGNPWVGPNLTESMNAIKWPACYLDFETMMTAVPLYPGTAPYTQIPTQYSVHKCAAVGDIRSHLEYLGDPQVDNRRDLARRLIADLEGDGSIVTYSNFEKTIINGLANLFPDLAGKLNSLTHRIFNLEAVIKDNYYHPAFHGSTSVKATLPALLPEMSYANLNIRDGGAAMAAFAYMALGRYTPAEIESLKKDLLAYCGQDTIAMVKLHQRLCEV